MKETRVASEKEFKKMRAYILSLYRGVTVKHSFVTRTGQYVDCVPFDQQPSLRGSLSKLRDAEKVLASPPPKPPAPAKRKDDSALPAGRLVGVGLSDEFGNEMECPAGCIPMRRITLELLTTFKTLSDFFAKPSPTRTRSQLAPSSTRRKRLPQGAAAPIYRHAKGYQYVNNFGAHSSLNLWSPTITPDTYHSLSQIWVEVRVSYLNNDHLQTIEIGWQVSPRYSATQAVLFIYYTSDGYQTGCYNTECPGFVLDPKPPTVLLGTPGYFKNFSTIGGAQYEFSACIDMGYSKNWWVYVDPDGQGWQQVGYYPTALFNNPNNNLLTINSNVIEFGGEICYKNPPYPKMVSGLFGQRSYGYAAYQSYIQYRGTDSNIYPANLYVDTPNPVDFTAEVYTGQSQLQKVYFGGPGRLFLAYIGDNSDDLLTAYYDGFEWAGNAKIKNQPGVIAPKSKHAPAAAVYTVNGQERLYLVYTDVASKEIYTTYYDGSTWYDNQPVIDLSGNVITSDSGPTACVYDNRLYVIFLGQPIDLGIFAVYYDGNQWQNQWWVASMTSPAPSAIQYDTRLYIAFREALLDSDLSTAYSDGSIWYSSGTIEDQSGKKINPKSSGSPGMAVY
jgi:hypothetical protein